MKMLVKRLHVQLKNPIELIISYIWLIKLFLHSIVDLNNLKNMKMFLDFYLIYTSYILQMLIVLSHVVISLKILRRNMDSDIDGDELFYELKIVRKCLPKEIKRAIEVLDYLKMMYSCFPNVWIAYRILLTTPVTVVSAKRSFLKLKLIKSYIRSIISQERLNGLTILSIEKYMLE